jgi:hypothetical protein
MPLRTYRLVVSETDTSEGITADVYNEDGTLEETTRIPYEDYGLVPERGSGDPDEREQTFDADVLTMQLRTARSDGVTEIAVLGDGDRLCAERITDEEWGLTGGS